MKKETKELVKWAKSLIEDYRVQNMVEHSNFRKNTPAAQNSEIEIKNCKDFTEFLNSLPEIESHLCRGGYIQDKNGIPCCDGDRVSYCINSKESCGGVGILFWDKKLGCFCLMDKYPEEENNEGASYNLYHLNDLKYFEKISYPGYLDKSWGNVEVAIKKLK